VFQTPVVRVVYDQTVFVLCYLIPFHNPFNGRLAINYILINFSRYVFNGNVKVINPISLIYDKKKNENKIIQKIEKIYEDEDRIVVSDNEAKK